MSTFQEILDEPDETDDTSTSSTEPVIAEPTGEATPETPAVEARTGEEPAPDGGANTAAPPAPITRDDGATWNEKSKRWYKDGKIVAGEAPEAPPPKVEQAPEAPTAPVAEVPKVEAPAPVTEPFRFRANGQKYELPGVAIADPKIAEQVRGLLIDGVNHRQNFPKLQREAKDSVAKAEAAGNAKADKYNRASIYLLGQLETALADKPEQLAMLKREVGLMLREADLSIPKAAATATEADDTQTEQAARATLSQYVTELLEDTPDAVKYFTDEDRKELAEAFQLRIAAYFVEHEGETVLDTYAAKKDFDRELKIAQRAHQARETAARDAQKAKAAAAFNAAQQAPGVPKPPTSPKPKPALAAAPSGPPAKSWDQSFKRAWDDTDDEE